MLGREKDKEDERTPLLGSNKNKLPDEVYASYNDIHSALPIMSPYLGLVDMATLEQINKKICRITEEMMTDREVIITKANGDKERVKGTYSQVRQVLNKYKQNERGIEKLEDTVLAKASESQLSCSVVAGGVCSLVSSIFGSTVVGVAFKVSGYSSAVVIASSVGCGLFTLVTGAGCTLFCGRKLLECGKERKEEIIKQRNELNKLLPNPPVMVKTI